MVLSLALLCFLAVLSSVESAVTAFCAVPTVGDAPATSSFCCLSAPLQPASSNPLLGTRDDRSTHGGGRYVTALTMDTQWNMFSAASSMGSALLASAASRGLTAGHTTVNATTVEATEAKNKVLHAGNTAQEGTTHAGVGEPTRHAIGIRAQFSEMVAQGRRDKERIGESEPKGRDVYQDIMAKGQWANNIMKRTKASPDDLVSELQMLEAKFARAQVNAAACADVAAVKVCTDVVCVRASSCVCTSTPVPWLRCALAISYSHSPSFALCLSHRQEKRPQQQRKRKKHR